ncbi:hypothetical protein ADU20_27290 [Burkholderia pseudomallei]|uniref:hypothetical protein n=1 Tax=Burkholderia pseudomallei TaxID=28450 RepID=UPI0006830E52|nr:hypothetical protein [Burkholderia pseudomallei]KNA31030.1 hypothetical protein ADU20_27290 [Burkholderia pseudomallei]
MGQTCAAGFYPAFKANMEAIGLDVPTNLFSTHTKAVETIARLAGLVKSFGMKVTIRELIGAGEITEMLSVVAAYSAAYYLGGAIGSLVVATDNWFGCTRGPVSQAQVHRAMLGAAFALSAPMQALLFRHPEIVNPSFPARRNYGGLARAHGAKR